MTTDEFWNLIHATTAPTQEEQLERFRAELRQLSQPELLEFMRHFYVTRQAAYTWDIWMVTWLCMGGLCSDDTFTDFRSWLIASGRAPKRVYLECSQGRNVSHFDPTFYIASQNHSFWLATSPRVGWINLCFRLRLPI